MSYPSSSAINWKFEDGYTCRCGAWVPNGLFHQCYAADTNQWSQISELTQQRIAAALERIAASLERLEKNNGD